MFKKLFFLLIFSVQIVAFGQQCPSITFPADGQINVAVDATITWQEVTGINGYLISLGTTPGGTDILSREATGIINSYKSPVGLPENTPIYLSLSILDATAQPIPCGGIVFTTIDVITPPPCTILIGPDDNAANVTIVTDIIWQYAPTATSYTLSIGTSQGGSEILNELNVGNVLLYNPPTNLPQNVRIYVTIRPENENGSSAPCNEESFFTGPIDDPCTEVDQITGESVSLGPEIEFPTLFIKCKESSPIMVSATGDADGYRWYSIDDNNEILLSQNRDFQIRDSGNYILEAYNLINRSGILIECASSRSFNVLPSEPAIIESVYIRQLTVGKQVTVNVVGNGDYEFTLDDENGEYQEDSIFVNVAEGPHVIHVRDKNGCGIVSRLIERGLKSEDFPNFFTPNGDGINDFWQIIPPPEIRDVVEVVKGNISIFDRYGILLFHLDPKSLGWDGSFNGSPLPASDYWFKAIFSNNQEIQGHFALKR